MISIKGVRETSYNNNMTYITSGRAHHYSDPIKEIIIPADIEGVPSIIMA
jgi:hypothetical protein